MDDAEILSRLIEFIRKSHRVSPKVKITSETLLEFDLGITGDDGVELIEAIEQEFGVSFVGLDGSYREAFDLEDGQRLFHGESFGAMLSEKNVVKLSVGQLLNAILKVKKKS